MAYLRFRPILTLLVAILAAGCSDITGPLFSLDVEVRGPRSMVGQWREAEAWSGVPAGYRCEPRLTLVAKNGSSRHNSSLVWSSLTIRRYDADGSDMGEPLVYTGDRLDWMLGHLSSGGQYLTDRIPVVADSLPFRWRMELQFYDPDTGRNGSAKFSSRCVDVS